MEVLGLWQAGKKAEIGVLLDSKEEPEVMNRNNKIFYVTLDVFLLLKV